MKVQDILFRASQLGNIMSGVKKGWTVENSLTCKRELVKIYRRLKYNRELSFSNKFTEKGNDCEEDAISLYSRLKKIEFKKNTIRLSNEFITGELDLFKGKSITEAEETVDIKNSWSLDTFPSILDKPDDDYVCQGNAYMALTGAKSHVVAYCLVNATPKLIEDAKRKAAYSIDVLAEDFVIECKKIECDMIFDYGLFKQQNPRYALHTPIEEWKFDIPNEERVIEFSFKRDDELIKSVYKRITECREWMVSNLGCEV